MASISRPVNGLCILANAASCWAFSVGMTAVNDTRPTSFRYFISRMDTDGCCRSVVFSVYSSASVDVITVFSRVNVMASAHYVSNNTTRTPRLSFNRMVLMTGMANDHGHAWPETSAKCCWLPRSVSRLINSRRRLACADMS